MIWICSPTTLHAWLFTDRSWNSSKAAPVHFGRSRFIYLYWILALPTTRFSLRCEGYCCGKRLSVLPSGPDETLEWNRERGCPYCASNVEFFQFGIWIEQDCTAGANATPVTPSAPLLSSALAAAPDSLMTCFVVPARYSNTDNSSSATVPLALHIEKQIIQLQYSGAWFSHERWTQVVHAGSKSTSQVANLSGKSMGICSVFSNCYLCVLRERKGFGARSPSRVF